MHIYIYVGSWGVRCSVSTVHLLREKKHSLRYLRNIFFPFYSVSSDIVNDDWDKMRLVVWADGLVNWFAIGQFLTSCKMNLFYLPFDTHTCTINITNLVGTAEYNNLTALGTKVKTTDLIQSNEWTLLDAEQSSNQQVFTGYSISRVEVTLHLKWCSSYYVITMIFPIFGISFLSLVVRRSP